MVHRFQGIKSKQLHLDVFFIPFIVTPTFAGLELECIKLQSHDTLTMMNLNKSLLEFYRAYAAEFLNLRAYVLKWLSIFETRTYANNYFINLKSQKSLQVKTDRQKSWYVVDSCHIISST